MTGVQLSRWTLSYFGCAVLFLLAGEAAFVAGLADPVSAPAAPATLAVVHVLGIGWLSLAMVGALTQFVPVLVARPLALPWAPLPALIGLVAGLGVLVAGFLQLGSAGATQLPFLGIGAALLTTAFALVIANIALTLWRARPLALPARFVGLGLAGLGATVALGALFALVLQGSLAGDAARQLFAEGLPLHVVAAFGGWLTVSAAGVSYRLLAMFMLSPDAKGRSGVIALACVAAALFIALAGGVTTILSGSGSTVMLVLALPFALIALACYGRDMRALYRLRQRRLLEMNSRMAALALVNLAILAVLIVAAAAQGDLAAHVDAVVFLAAFGWLSALVLAKLPKIVSFLTWLHVYGPVLGRRPTPRVQDLVDENRASRWFVLFHAGVWAGTLALFTVAETGFRIAMLAMLLASFGLAAEILRIRMLGEIPPALRPAPQLRRFGMSPFRRSTPGGVLP